ncbi:solute carrier family 13 member 2-like isoform X2 [Glandiceps talaboti]
MVGLKKCCLALWSLRNIFILILTPVVFCPLLMNGRSDAACGYVLILVSVYWIFEILPLTMTGIIPLFLFPILGIMNASDTASAYTKDAVYFIFGSFCVAIAIEKWNLHKRIALLSLLLAGSKPASILLGFMLVSFFLSMWMVNTATASLIIPIAQAVAEEMKTKKKDSNNVSGPNELLLKVTVDNIENLVTGGKSTNDAEKEQVGEDIEKKPETRSVTNHGTNDNINKAFLLGIAYCSLMGGTASLVGSTQTVYMKSFIDSNYGSQVMPFSSWLAVAVSCQVVSILIGWIWLQWLFLDLSFRNLFGASKCCRKKATEREGRKYTIKDYIRRELKVLGPVSWAEGSVLAIFILAILAWFFADPVMFPGWISLDKRGFVSITTSSNIIPILLFILPADPRGAYIRFKKDVSKTFEWETLMDMNTMQTKYPWMLVFLIFGCLLALGKGCQVSGLSLWIADQLSGISTLEPWLIVLIMTTSIALLCEALGNVSVVVVFLPILAEMAHSMEVNPLYFIIPSTLAASFAFMLPIASGPNIVAYSYGNLRVMDMVKAGFLMNVICIFIVNVCTHTLCVWIFDIYTYPDWAPRTTINMTTPETLNTTAAGV